MRQRQYWTILKSLRDLDRFPPCLCVTVARDGRRSLPYTEIAKRAGIHRITAIRLGKLTSWRSVTVDMALRFSEACGVNLLHPSDHIEYLKRLKTVRPRQAKLLMRLKKK